jgi:hypothetical protein
MTLPSRIVGNNKHQVNVTTRGELIVSSLSYSEPFYVELGVNDQIYNVVPAVAGKRFVITGAFIGADRNVTTDASIHIYEALSVSGTSERSLFQADINRGEFVPITGLNVITEPARWINATTDDDDVDITIAGYYVDE